MSRPRTTAALALVALALRVCGALAQPPPAGSEDEQIMRPFAEWVATQHTAAGNWCCSVSDGRPVVTKIDKDGRWLAHVTKEHWPTAGDHWLVIPDDKVLHEANPIGVAILWYNVSQDRAYCFIPGSAI